MDYNKRYIVGTIAKMKELFPQYAGHDERTSLDKSQVIYEVNLSDDELTALKKRTSVKIYTHAEILSVLNAPISAGVWYEIEPVIASEAKQSVPVAGTEGVTSEP